MVNAIEAPVERGWFADALSPLLEPGLAELRSALGSVEGLGTGERARLAGAVDSGVHDVLGRLLTRLLLLELNAARVTGTLHAADPAARWAEFVDRCGDRAWWETRTEHYPTMLARVDRVVRHRCAAGLTLARRFAADREALSELLGAPTGELREVRLGQGDSHHRGNTVAMIRVDGGVLHAKPRPLGIDAELTRFLDALRTELPTLRIRVPAVLDRGDHGWAAHIEHSYCTGDDEFADFYRGAGHWLAVLRLLGGGDMHGENVVAAGPVPVVIDCETLIAPQQPAPTSDIGQAGQRGAALIAESVLRVGLLPSRGIGLGWRGVDGSAVGGLPGEQPMMPVPVILDGGLDTARMAFRLVEQTTGDNHPAAEPTLATYWHHVLDGFTELTATLRGIDDRGDLEPLLDRFREHRVRVVLRDTEAYAEHLRMLWHPTSLHNEPAAVARAQALLQAHGRNNPGVPSDDVVTAAEIADLLDADIPVFATTPARGLLDGPQGTSHGEPADLLAQALHRWRLADEDLERTVIRASLVGAYLNDGWEPDGKLGPPDPGLVLDDTDRRRLAAGLVRTLRDTAVRGDDGTATWIAPVLDPTGWQVQTSSPDLYNGLGGIAVLLAGYRAETAAGRADPVDGVDALLHDTVASLVLVEDNDRAMRARDRAATGLARPPAPGGYLGLGSQIHTWLTLRALGLRHPGVDDPLHRALTAAAELPEAIAEDVLHDVLGGTAGAVVALLELSDATGDDHWLGLATDAGSRLVAAAEWATVDGADTACWPSDRWPRGLGGFAHGATGIGWALARLADVTGDAATARCARAAFAYEQSLYDPDRGGWLDAREHDPYIATAWCHGGTGVGLAAADLMARGLDVERHRDVLRRAALSVHTHGLSWNHTLCHGDLGAWELLDAALAAGVAPAGLDRSALDTATLAGLHTHGMVSGLARDAYAPGLLPGEGGAIWQLLRMNRACPLPSVLIPNGVTR